jgi:hypothetical protein
LVCELNFHVSWSTFDLLLMPMHNSHHHASNFVYAC